MTKRYRPPAVTKPGKCGTLYLHEIEYTDASGEDPTFTTRLWGYTREHAIERFCESPDAEGWRILRIARVRLAPSGDISGRHAWTWHRVGLEIGQHESRYA